MARRSQCSSAGDNPLDPNYLPPHYREEYRLAVDSLVESGLEGYYDFLQKADVVDFLSSSELQYIQSCVQAPRQSSHPDQQQQLYPDCGGDGSSDTYWPVHSDLDVPGLDLGWPQVHAFMEPTEVTTLVNPPEPDMPSIKEQARRLIKNAQQVVAVAMDVFTDVDMFADILNATARRVAVYILLDEQNAHHFVSMVANCRVNLDNFQFLRVRTVSGISYRCRSGKTFKGQMMDRFLLTDCRAVLSGNYSFMWSFEKLHRCMAHLFLGQLVTTFDEEFRILFAQSQPLIVENVLAPMEDLNFLQQKQYFNENAALHRDPRKFLTPDSGHPDEWERHSYDKRMDGDWRMMALKNQDSLRNPADVYGRFGSQQAHMDPGFDQGPARMLMTENPALKRHSYAEGVHGRYSMSFMQGMLEPEPKGKVFHRGQQPYLGPEPDYSGYDRFWNQDYPPADQYPEPYLPQELPQQDFDPVLNYLSSTRNLDFDQSSEKFPPAADLPYASPRSKRRGLAQPYPYQTSPTPSNSAEQNQFLQDPAVSRKDPAVKQGLRNWRISSYLSAYDNPEEEGLPSVPLQGPDAFDEPLRPVQQTAPGMDLLVPKVPYVKEFKTPAIPRPSQMPSYAKGTPQEKPKLFLDEPAPAPVEIKVTPTPSESSADVEKTEEPKVCLLTREDSFRRQYNAAAQRSSRLRSSLIFSSLDQQHEADQPDEEKNKTEQTKLPFAPHVSRQRKSTPREPLEWIRFMIPTEASKAEDKDSSKEAASKDLSENPKAKEPAVESTAQSKPPEAELPKTDQLLQPTKPFLTAPLFVDMSDADQRLMFFKELAAKRKAAEATKAEKKKDKAETKQVDSKNSFQKKEAPQNVASELRKASISEGLIKNPAAGEAESALNVSRNTSRKNSLLSSDLNTSSSFTKQTKPFESEKTNFDKLVSDLPVPADTDSSQGKLKEQTEFSKECPSPSIPRSTSSEAKLLENDQLAEPTKLSQLYVDFNDPHQRFKFFKQLAAKQKADEAAKDRSEIKPQVDSKTHESVNSVVESSENTVSKERRESLVNIESGSEKTELDKQPLSLNRRTSLEQTESVTFIKDSQSFTRSTSSEAKLPETDQSAEPTKSSQLYGDLNDPYQRYMFFKQLAPKQKADEAVKVKSEIKPQVDTKTPESIKSVVESSENTVSKERCESLVNIESGSEKTELDKQPLSLNRRTSLEQTESVTFIKDRPSFTRSMSSDPLVEPTKPIHVDANNPYRRFLCFKELSGKRNATKADNEKAEELSLNVRTETKPPESDSSNAQTKLSENTVSDDRSASAGTDPSQNKSLEQTVSESFVKRPGPLLARSKSTEAELLRTDRSVPPTEPLPATSFKDMSDTESRFTYFKELAAKRKAALAEKEQNNAVMKQVNLKIGLVLLEDPNEASSTNALIPEEVKRLGTTSSTETTESVLSLEGNTTVKDRLVEVETPQTCGDQETKLFISEETDTNLSESPKVQESAAFADVSSGTDKTESLTPESTSGGSVSDPPSSVESSLETKTASLLPSEQNTGSELPDFGSENFHPPSGDPSSSDIRPEPSNVDTTKVQEISPDTETGLDSVPNSRSSQSQSAHETPQNPHSLNVEPVSSSASCENPSAGSDNPPGSDPTQLQSSSSEECSAPAEGAELGKEDSAAEASKSSEDIKADGSFGPEPGLLGTSGPESSSSKPDEKVPLTIEDAHEFDAPTPAEAVPPEPERSDEPDVSAVGLKTVSSETRAESEVSAPSVSGQTSADLTDKTSKNQTPEPAELGSVDTDDRKSENPELQNKNSIICDKTNQMNENDSEPTDGKQLKPNPSRYLSSTANVLSSSNLRDDTKLLLGKISANCQSRNEANREPPATDDEKEDKNAKNEKDGRLRGPNRGIAKPNPEREKVLERFDSMRKEKRVYSRFMF